MGDVRRRQMMGGAKPDIVAGYKIPGNKVSGNDIIVEHPDCFRYDFYRAAGGQFSMGYWFHEHVQYVILDGENVAFGKISNGTLVVDIPTTGDHILYVKTKDGVWANHHGMYYGDLYYVRYPNNAHIHQGNVMSWGGTATTWRIIDMLDTQVFTQMKNTLSTTQNSQIVRVPIGLKQQYINAGAFPQITNKMIEVNFKYKV